MTPGGSSTGDSGHSGQYTNLVSKVSKTAISSDSTVQDSAEVPKPLDSQPSTLWVIGSADSSAVNMCIALDRDQPLLLGRKVERGGVAIKDTKMSRVHARIAWDGRVSAFRIADEKSANGTFVDGVRIASAPLRPPAVIRTGQTVFIFAATDPSANVTERIARAGKTELSVLILGETGTGKERAARQLHKASGRTGDFIAVNCATFPKDLIAAELFGHARGAFSGADRAKLGLFRAADKGTLFLDELADLPLDVQPALLRVLQERRVRPVGSERELPIDVRVLAATQPERLNPASFRSDLHARLSQVEIHLPPLRQRTHELPHLLDELATDADIQPVTVSAQAMEALALAPWPQNIRELQNLLSRLRVFRDPPYHLDKEFLRAEAPTFLPDSTEALPHSQTADSERESGTPAAVTMTRASLEELLKHNQGKVSAVAKATGVSRTQVYRWLKRFGIAPPSERQ